MATYPPPNPQQGSIFNPSDWIEGNNSNLDIEYLNEHYCKFPVAQGNMSFAGINNTGTTTIGQNLVMTGTPNVNYLEFPDGTKQYTAVAGDDILDTANVFTQNNTFPSISFNTGTGANLTSSNGGLVSDSNINTPSLLIDDGNNDIYSVRSENGYGFILANINGNGSLTISNNGSTFSTLSVSTTGMSCNTSLILPAQTSYTPSTTYGNTASTQEFVQKAIATVSGGDASLTANQTFSGSNTFTKIVNEGVILSIGNNLRLTLDTGTNFYQSYLNLTSSGITTISTPLNLPAQTSYSPSTTYGNASATQQFVQKAIETVSGGDVSLAGTNNFTGINTFNTNIPTSTVSQTYPSISTTDLATIGYVNSLAGTISPSDVSLAGTNNFTGTNTYNVNLPTSTIGGVYPNYNTPNSFATIGYVNSLTTTVDSTFTANLNILAIYYNSLITHIVGNIVYYNGTVSFTANSSAYKVTFNITPVIPVNVQVAITNGTLFDGLNNYYVSYDASQTYLFSNSLVLQSNVQLSSQIYTFSFSGSAQYA
jgi:hypothetical protein